jgi:WD40 repeat protein
LTQWDVKTGLGYWYKGGKGHEGKNLTAIGVSADGKTVVSAGFDDRLKFSGADRVWGADSVSLGGQPVALAMSPVDSGLVAVILTQEKLVLVKDGKVASELTLGYRGMCLEFSADGKQIIVGGKHKKAVIYTVDGTTATPGLSLETDSSIGLVHGSPDGKFWVTVDKNRNITFWDQKGTSLNQGWGFHSSNIEGGAFSPSGRRYASSAADEFILIWNDFTTFNPQRLKIKAHPQGVAHVGWLEENTLASVGDDRVIKIWTIPESF